MMFHAPTGRYVLPADALRLSAMHMKYAIAKVREQAKKPLEGYKCPGPMGPAEFAQGAILEAAEAIGIDMGMPRNRATELDVRDAG